MSGDDKSQPGIAVFAAAALAFVGGATLGQHASECPAEEGSGFEFLLAWAQGVPLLDYAPSTFAELLQLVLLPAAQKMRPGFCL